MQKHAPSPGRLAVSLGFALSCFGLFLFLWVSFGGPIPLKPEAYRFTMKVGEAARLATEADVRISGVNVGKVKDLDVDDVDNLTVATIELDNKYGPLPADSRAVLRMKSLVGETFIELAPGSDGAPKIPEGGELEDANVQEQVQIDEIFNAFNDETREDWRQWQQGAVQVIKGEDFMELALDGEESDPDKDRAEALSDALGNFGPLAEDAADLLETVNRQDRALQRLFRNAGEVFAALSERQDALRGLIVDSNTTFRTLAERDRSLAEIFQIFPTFLDESRLTADRLRVFAEDTNPLVDELRPVARELTPTLIASRRLAPHLERLFQNLDPLIDASEEGLPALRRFLDGFRTVTPQLDPFLANLVPVLRFLEANKGNMRDFFNPGAGISGTLAPRAGDPAPRRFLRVLSYGLPSVENIAIHTQRLATNRGNKYRQDFVIGSEQVAPHRVSIPAFDCKNTPDPEPGQTKNEETGELSPGVESMAACILHQVFPEEFGGRANPEVTADP